MKLTIIPAGPLAFEGQTYLYSNNEGLYLDGIAKYFEEVIICAYALHKEDIGYDAVSHYRFKSSNLKFAELPLSRNVNAGILSKFIQMGKVCKTILANIKNWDLLYLFLPGYPSAITYLINKFFHKQYLVYLASDWPEESPILFPWKGLTRKLFYPLYYKFNEWIERKIVEGSFLILTAGRATLEKYKNYGKPIYETVPRLNWSDFEMFFREDTCQSTPVRLLFVGYLLPRKGPSYLLEAVSILKNRGNFEVFLTIVGDGEQREELEELVHELGISDKVEFLGYVPNGHELWKVYRESDIFILPTPFGEGFPRVLYEAMAQSIPIVTTNVSGIPYKMKHEENALLIPPRSPEAIADSVERVIKDKELRMKLIKNGQRFMQNLFLSSDSGNQVHSLLKNYFPKYRRWIENRI